MEWGTIQIITGSAKVEKGSVLHLDWGVRMRLRPLPGPGMQVMLLPGQIWSILRWTDLECAMGD